MAKLLYFISEDWFFCSHFLDRAKLAQSQGFEIVVLAREGRHAQRIKDAGFRIVGLDMERSSTQLWKEWQVLRQVWRVYGQEKPDVLHHVALKPIIYGSLVARLRGLRAVVNAPVGMGYVFTSQDKKVRWLRPLVGLFLRNLLNPQGSKVIFENSEDLQAHVLRKAVRPLDAVLIQGAGVDTAVFHPVAAPQGDPIVVMAARMLKDKGVVEFVAAARLLRQRGVGARFWLVGAPDPGNPSSLTKAELMGWQAQGDVEWLGHQDDMPSLLQRCHIACLPSYREGLPKFLLEAMASGLAVVSTDVPGCRTAVQHGLTGLLVPARDVVALADALAQLISQPLQRADMGRCARARVEREFSGTHINQQTLELYQRLVATPFNGTPHTDA
ncbi:glycosyltransferase family 4 protein [Rhodoferax sp. WC2427]|uniref:glycosyltransferase family 4 protein n=1 Tax=Rhodoferax sp. WC2427 TaxID=3234144 RepID=UPI003464FEBC